MRVDDIVGEVEAAALRIRAYVPPSPVLFLNQLSDATGVRVHLKLENAHPTGSFKLRGAFSKLTWLKNQTPDALVVTASTGNHALAMAYALDLLAMQGRLFLPYATDAAKLAELSKFDVPMEMIDSEPAVVERHAREWAEQRGGVYVSPYNDPQVLAGQGTMAAELMRQVPRLSTVYASVGGGGLVSGVAGYLKAQLGPPVQVVGCQPANDAAMFLSIGVGEIVDIDARPTLSDGTAGGIDHDSVTFPACRDLVDRWRLVSEEQIASAMRTIYSASEWHETDLIEGAAGVAVAGFLQDVEEDLLAKDAQVVLVICGGNIGWERFHQVCEGGRI